MSFRTIVIKNRVKLELSMNYLICRGEKEVKINLDEISLVIIQNLASSTTIALLSKLVEKKIGVIVCDEKNNPQFELVPYYSTHNSFLKIKNQIIWSKNSKDYLWKEIIKKKIYFQAYNLKILNYNDSEKKLLNYLNEIELGDVTNREGHAAKVYFNTLFGQNFSRKNSSDVINKYLNYGYSIILSAINREIVAFGYLSQLGIHHIGETNPFNLSCDFMEVLRPMIDSYVIKNIVNEENYKEVFINALSLKCKYENKIMFLDNAIHLYVQDLINYLNTGDIEKIKFIEYES